MNMDEGGAEQFLRLTLNEPDKTEFTQGADLKPFADQLIAIARKLRVGDFVPSDAAKIMVPVNEVLDEVTPAGPEEFAAMAKRTYAIRRRRSSIFGNPDLFGEPGWDILLDLYIAYAEQKPVSVSSACIGSAAPPTTGLRWLGVLAEEDLIIREQDPDDQRRVLVRLTQRGVNAMETYFSNAAAG